MCRVWISGLERNGVEMAEKQEWTIPQFIALLKLAGRYGSDFTEYWQNFTVGPFDLPNGYVSGWILDKDGYQAIYVGCSAEGEVSS